MTLQWNGHTWTDHNSIISEYTRLKDLLPTITTNPLLNKIDNDGTEEDGGMTFIECMLSQSLYEYDETSQDNVMKYAKIYARRCPNISRLREVSLEIKEKGLLDVLKEIRQELVEDGKRNEEDVMEIREQSQLVHEMDAMLE